MNMKKVYAIPFNTDFLERLSEFIRGNCQQLSGTAIVFAGKRPSLYMKRILGRGIVTPEYSPRFFSIEEFIDYIARKRFPGFKDLERPDAVWLLYQSIRSLPPSVRHPFQQKSFGDFFYWGGHLLDFIDRLDSEDVANDRLRSLEENAGIGYDVPESINELLTHVSILRDSFHGLLDETACFTRGYKYLTASRIIGEQEVDEFEKIYFAGLFGLLGTEKVILKDLWNKERAEIIFEGIPSDWSLLKGFVAYLGADVEYITSETAQPPSVSIHSGFDTHSEILKVHRILKDNHKEKTAVILPLSDALFPLLTFVTDRISVPCNIAIGYSLERTPVFDLIAHIIRAQASRQGNGTYPVTEYLRVLLHPFVKNTEADKGTWQMLLDISRLCTGEIEGSPLAYKPFIALDEVERGLKTVKDEGRGTRDESESVQRSTFNVQRSESKIKDDGGIPYEIVHEIHDIFFGNFEGAATLYEYAENLETALEYVMDHTPVRSYILSGEVFRSTLAALEGIKGLSFSKTGFYDDREENRRLICDFTLRLLQPVSLPFETKPIESLEIIGVLESRNISFDTAIIMDANEGILPQQRSVDPLIPAGVHEMLGIPSPRQGEEIYRYYFERLVLSSKNVHILYVDAEDRPRSRYIERIIWDAEKTQKAIDVIPIDRSVYPINLRPGTAMPAIEKTSFVMELLQSKPFSPSSIDHYIFCPVFFYYRDILSFEEKKTISDDIEATERGTMIHRILQETFEGCLNREISKPMHTEIIARLNRVIDRRMNESADSGDYYLFKKLAAFKLQSFLQKNLNNAPDPFTIVHLEQRLEHTIDAGGTVVNLIGKADRIDLDPGTGQYTIIDYKTGGATQYRRNFPQKISLSRMNDIHRYISSFQLPLYIYLFHGQNNVPVSAVNAKLILLRNNAEEYLFREVSMEEREALYETYLTGVRTTLLDILDPARPFTPFDDKGCAECIFNHLCHV
jgi:ATP-dependent helicase/nuclease subunit B